MDEKKVFFKNLKGQKLAALLAMPENKNPPIIIIIHGFKGTKEYYPMVNNAVKPFVDAGFAVLRIDCRGSGESDMEFKDMTLYSEAEDILTAVDYVKTLDIDKENIGVIAISMAVSAVLIAKPKVRTIVFWGPGWKLGLGSYYDKPEHHKSIKEEGVWHVTAKDIPTGKVIKKLVAGKELFKQMLTLNLTKELSKLKNVPTLILRGEKDEVTNNRGDDDVVKSMHSELKIIKKGDHNFVDKDSERDLINETVFWFKQRFKRKVIIVNEKDEQIGLKVRKDIKKEDMYRVSALWITNSKGEILLAQRGLNKKHDPGKWGPAVAGTLEEGETYESNIIKETEEELGLKNVSFKKGPKVIRHNEHHYFCQWFTLKIDKKIDQFTIQKEEVEKIAWFKKEDLIKEIKTRPEKFLKKVDAYVELFS